VTGCTTILYATLGPSGDRKAHGRHARSASNNFYNACKPVGNGQFETLKMKVILK
jgi:hypothetical protein